MDNKDIIAVIDELRDRGILSQSKTEKCKIIMTLSELEEVIFKIAPPFSQCCKEAYDAVIASLASM